MDILQTGRGKGRVIIVKPEMQVFAGVVVIIDISGSTEMAQKMDLSGQYGIEEFRKILESTFTILVSKLENSGATLAYLAGDALVAYWKNDEFPLDELLPTANACCNQILEGMGQTSGDEFRPTVHIGIGVGLIELMYVGGVNDTWRLILSGSAIAEASRAEKHATAGQIAIRSTDIPYDFPRIVTPNYRKLRNLPFAGNNIDDPISEIWNERFEINNLEGIGEFRHVECLYFRVFPSDEEHLSNEFIQRLYSGTQKIVNQYCSTQCVLIREDDSFLIKLYLGIHFDTYLNARERILDIAKDLSTNLPVRNIDWSIAISNGRCLCDLFSVGERYRYVVTGLPMFYASRISNLFRNGIYLTSDSMTDIHSEQFELVGNHILKGFSYSTSVYTLVSDVKSVEDIDPMASFVGREHEIKEACEFLDFLSTDDQHNRYLYIYGVAGVGKSSFVDIVARSLHSVDDAIWLFNRNIERLQPLGIWSQFISRLLEMRNLYTSNDVQSAIVAILHSNDMEMRLPLVSSLLSLDVEETSFSKSLNLQARVESTEGALVEIALALLSEHPVIVIEDCQWVDSASARLLLSLFTRARSCRLILTSRSDRVDGIFSDVLSDKYLSKQHLQNLSRSEQLAFINDKFNSSTVDPDLAEEIAKKSNGNPFVLDQFLRYLQQQEIITNQSGHLYFTNISSIEFEQENLSLQQLITSQLDDLDHDQLMIVRVAALLGRTISRSILKAVLSDSISVEETDKCLKHLTKQGLLKKGSNEDTYLFTHDLFPEVIEDVIRTGQKLLIHEQIADVIESEMSQMYDGSSIRQLAYHWGRTENNDKSLFYGNLAIDEALKSGAYLEAMEYIGLCLEHAQLTGQSSSIDVQHVVWMRKLCDCYHGVGNQTGRFGAAVDLIQYCGYSYPEGVIPTLSRTVFDYFYWQVTKKIKKTVQNNNIEKELSLAHRHASYAGYFVKDPITTVYDSMRGVIFAEKSQFNKNLAGVYAMLGGYLGILGLWKMGKSYLGRSVHHALDEGDVAEIAHSYMVYSLFLIGIGEWSSSRDYGHRCLANSSKSGNQITMCNSLIILFWNDYYINRLDSAIEFAQKLVKESQSSGNIQQEVWGYNALIIANTTNGKYEEATIAANRVFRLLNVVDQPTEKMTALAFSALLLSFEGDIKLCHQHANEAADILSTMQTTSNHGLLMAFVSLLNVSEYLSLRGVILEKNLQLTSILKKMMLFKITFPIGKPAYDYWKLYSKGSTNIRSIQNALDKILVSTSIPVTFIGR